MILSTLFSGRPCGNLAQEHYSAIVSQSPLRSSSPAYPWSPVRHPLRRSCSSFTPSVTRRTSEIKMAVRLRLARFGRRNRPFYRVMAADSRSPRDGKHVEAVGYYDPLPGKDGSKPMGLKVDRVKYWLSVGAQPSDPVKRLLYRAGILPRPPNPMMVMGRKKGDRDPDTLSIDPSSGECLTPESTANADQPEESGNQGNF